MNQLPELDQVRQALSGFADLVNNASNSTSLLGRDTEEAGRQIKAFGELQKKVMDQTGKALGSLGSAVMNTQTGFAKYNDALDAGSNVLKTFVEAIPIVGKALGALIGVAAAVGKQFTIQADNVTKANNSLKQLGTAGSFTGEQLLKFGHNAGLTSRNLELLIKPIQSLGTGVLALGKNTGEGVETFARLTAITSTQREAFQRLGISQEQLMQNQADYITLQRISATNMAKGIKDEATLQKLTLEYTDSLQVLAAVSGRSAEEVKKRQMDAMNDRRFQIAQIQLENQARRLEKTDPEAAAKLRQEAQARVDFMKVISSKLDPALTSKIGGFLASGNFNQANKELATLGMNMAQYRQALAKGEKAETVAAKVLDDLTKQQSKAFDIYAVAIANQEKLGDVIGASSEAMQNFSIYRDQNTKEEMAAAKARIEAAKLAGKDKLADADAALTSAAIFAAQGLDKVTLATNPLITNFNLMGGSADQGKKEAAAQSAAGVRPEMTTNAGGAAFVAQSSGRRRNVSGSESNAVGGAAVGGAAVGGAAVGGAAPTPGSSTAVSSKNFKPGDKNGFLSAMYAVLLEEAKKAGLSNPEAIAELGAKQSAVETGYGRSLGPGNNYFGIKGQGAVVTTQEYNSATGKMETVRDSFRKYGSMQESAADYIKFLTTNKRYAGVLSAGSAEEAILAQGKTGYATDPRYASKLMGINMPKGERGGIFSGSRSGYPVELHGNELVAPLNPSSVLARLLTTPESEMKSSLSMNTNSSQSSDNSRLVDVMMAVTEKLDQVLYTLKASQSIQDKLLQYSRT